jgi:hypothetical protein
MISHRTIAKQLGVSNQRVQQLEKVALAKVRQRLLETIPESELREFANTCGIEKDPYQARLVGWGE